MRRGLVRTIGILVSMLALAGCAEMFTSLNDRGERFKGRMEERGVEFHGGKAMKVYHF